MEPALPPPSTAGSMRWCWEIRRQSGSLVDSGTLLAWRDAQPGDIADEAMALQVWDLHPRMHLLKGWVCKAWRQDTPERFGESRGDDWIRTAHAV
jgi:hypothetical protein